jgi:hypothetical protein
MESIQTENISFIAKTHKLTAIEKCIQTMSLVELENSNLKQEIKFLREQRDLALKKYYRVKDYNKTLINDFELTSEYLATNM